MYAPGLWPDCPRSLAAPRARCYREGSTSSSSASSFDPVYGARPIKRTIQRLILDPLAQKVLTGEYKEGDTVFVDAQEGKIVFWSEQYAAEKAKIGTKNKPVGAGSRAN